MSQTNRANDVAAQGRKALEAGAQWREIQQAFFATGRAAAVQRALTQATDAAAVEAYQSALAAVLSGRAAMFAAGGFGRGELFPFSDADIIVVHEGDAPRNLNERVAEFVRSLWEKGVRPSQRVCTVEECLALHEQNADLSVKLLDRRLLAGDASVAATLDEELAGWFAKHGRRLGHRLAGLARARHAKYRNTPSHREPDVEETPGGLRDLRLIATLEKLCPEQVKSADGLDEAATFLSSVRCFLHYRAGQDRNILDVAAQKAIVERFAGGATPPAWMREYFKRARAIFNEARRALDSCEASDSSLIGTFRDWQSRLSNAEFTVLRERVYLRRPGAFGIDAETALRLLEFVAQHGIRPAPETERRLQAAKDAVAVFCQQPRSLWPALKTILSLPRAAGAFRVLQNTGLLPAIFPEWDRMEGVAANQPDHLYTIDEHTLMAMERICDLRENADPAGQRFAEILSEIEDQAVLLFALLFHHMGEGSGDPDSAQVAAALGRAAGARVKMPAPDQDTVAFLIERQTDLSDAVSGRDLDDPATVRLLASQIGTIERLRLLAALTYADIAATYSEATFSWRAEQLWRTYLATQRELTRELETDRIQELPASLPESAEFIKGFPMRYLRARTAEEIQAHTRLYELSRPTGVAVQLEQAGGAYKLSLIAQDMPALFASFAGAISSFGLDIVQAEAFANSKGVILDTFVFADPRHTLELNPPEAERLQDLIRRVALGKTDARRLLRNRARLDPKKLVVEPRVQFVSEACETATLVEIVAEDRPGLLYSLASVFSSNACNIDIVLIDTKGRRAIDVFYVAQEGGKLSPELQAKLKEQLLSACLGD
ncbi:MAG: nucleotidyltransferase domain-containing protein [Bryobacteraceae bacterium]